jgi:hypothetical protein
MGPFYSHAMSQTQKSHADVQPTEIPAAVSTQTLALSEVNAKTTVPDNNQVSRKCVGGKSIERAFTVEQPGPSFRSKSELHILTDDQTVYVWSRFNDNEPWTFDYRRRSDGSRDTTARQLPASVQIAVEADEDILY